MQEEVQMRTQNANKVALVLEGGSFRCQFTAGVLDVMLEQGINVAACYGVSAGLLGGLSFKSRQIGRVNRVNLAYCGDSRYMGAGALAESGSLVGYDFMLNDIQDRIDPFDNDAFLANPMSLVATVSDVVFGTPAYLEVANAVLDIDIIRATTSMPLVTPPVEIDGHVYLDGGITDSVPVEHVLEDMGYGRAIVVLTRHRGYQKTPYAYLGAAHARYAKYPYFVEALATRHERYNEQREHIWEYERDGRVLALVPPEPVGVGHVERDPQKLLALYIEGRQEAARRLEDIKAFVG